VENDKIIEGLRPLIGATHSSHHLWWWLLTNPGKTPDEKYYHEQNIRVLRLLDQIVRRQFLKPWWKRVFEYNNFMGKNFNANKVVKESLPKRISIFKSKKFENLNPEEFRSQLTKAVLKKTEEYTANESKKSDIDKIFHRPLADGEFFIIERSNKFYQLNKLKDIIVYTKENEVIKFEKDIQEVEISGFEIDANQKNKQYIINRITDLLPIKKYDDYFEKELFYIYLLPYERYVKSDKGIEKESYNAKRIQYYKQIEDAFVNEATRFAEMSEEKFDKIIDIV
jgi:hypothetical protein